MASTYPDAIYYAWLHMQKGMSNARFERVVSEFDSPKELFERLQGGEPIPSNALTNELWRTLCAHADESHLDQVASRLHDAGIRLLTQKDSSYPLLLRSVPHPPALLYLRGQGKIEDCTNAIAIVGSRKCSAFSQNIATRYAKALSDRGITVVSGMAFGTDAAAHRGALEGAGKIPTIAVLASGVDVPSPTANTGLYHSILERGIVLSEVAPGRCAVAGMFPIRNRIIAGLSHAVFVPEAGMTSGAWHTVNYADDLNREILACPGRIEDPLCAGSNEMLKLGATLVTSVDDLFGVFSFLPLPVVPKPTQKQALSDEELVVVDLLKKADLSADELFEYTGIPMNRLLSLLTNLTLQEIIERTSYLKYHLV